MRTGDAMWPVVVILHGWGSNRHDFDDDAEFLTTLGYVGITLDANGVIGPDAYAWTDSMETTNVRTGRP
jgi:predicted dienelactone hydrolase